MMRIQIDLAIVACLAALCCGQVVRLAHAKTGLDIPLDLIGLKLTKGQELRMDWSRRCPRL